MKNTLIKVGTEREKVFDKSLRYERQKNYNINNYEYNTFNFAGSEKKVYKNFNFSIFVDDYCNADCKFCVAQLRYSHRKQFYEKKHIVDDVTYLNRLDKVLELIRPLNPSVSITGGEPTLSPRLPEILKLVDSYNFRKRTITTNGSGLLNKKSFTSNSVLEQLIRYGWSHLNISRVSHDDKINQNIMCYKNLDDYCSNEKLKKIIKETNNSSLKHRISCLLLKESVCSVEKIKQYIDFYESYGINNFIFRELMDFSKDSINVDKMDYCIKNKIRLNDIWEDFENYSEFEPYFNILGYYYYVELYKYHNMVVASESADLNQQYVEKGMHTDMVYEMVFHTNGNLCGSWVDSEEVLDEYTT